MNIIVAILIFSVIIVIHELGHFLLAKKNGIFVTEFSIGMGQRVITFVKTNKGYKPRFFLSQHEFDTTPEWKDTTKYSWKLLPLGGSCMMLGEDEAVDDDRAFNKKGVWARISVIFAGPFFNFLLAFLLAIFIIGKVGYDPSTVLNVADNSPAQNAGLMEGDLITKINGKNIDIGREITMYLQFQPLTSENVTITYERDGKENTIEVTPEKVKTYMLGFYFTKKEAEITDLYEDYPMIEAGLQVGDVIVGFNDTPINSSAEISKYFNEHPLTDEPVSVTYTRNNIENTVLVTPKLVNESYSIGANFNEYREKTDVLGTVKYSLIEVKFWITTTVKSLGQLITGKLGTDDLAGPVGVVNVISDYYESSKSDGPLAVVLSLSYISVLLTANLGVMNLLPIPALDGGRLVFLFLELFRGKPIDRNKEGLVHMIGLIALMILMVFVMFNDISRLFS